MARARLSPAQSSRTGQLRATTAWVLFDWAYGAFTTVVATFVIPTYVARAVAASPAQGAAGWAWAQAAAGVVVATLALPLGAIADRGGFRRAMLAVAGLLMVAATMALWTVRPHAGDLRRALALVAAATVAFEAALIFYNAMLPDLAAPGRLGRLSMFGWASGYAGGLVCLGLCLVLLRMPPPLPFGLDRARLEDVRACAPLAGFWVLAFGWPVCLFGPDRSGPDRSGPNLGWRASVHDGLAGLHATWRRMRGQKGLVRFILARAIYTDGLVTLFAFGGIYAASRFTLDAKGVLTLGIALTVAAGIGTAACALIEDRIGAKATVLSSLAVLSLAGAAVLLAADRRGFTMAAWVLGLCVGPAQAASRSMMAHLAPADARSAYFGLFALSGRVSAFAGPLLLGAVTQATGSLRLGMAVILLFLVAGALLLVGVPFPGPGKASGAARS